MLWDGVGEYKGYSIPSCACQASGCEGDESPVLDPKGGLETPRKHRASSTRLPAALPAYACVPH